MTMPTKRVRRGRAAGHEATLPRGRGASGTFTLTLPPLVFIDGERIGGSDDLERYLAQDA